ncbi:MAG: peptidoglycan-binding domain-containing protein [Acidobacteria bacterium]|nr:peptidoglycan-binding domain-containing protein [Acidobacteriota bacterium]
MELSGVQFVGRFLGSRETAELVQPFRGNLERFLAALGAAGAAVHVTTTFRPAKRAYLMHHAFAISKGRIRADQVPPFDPAVVPADDPHKGPLDISWVHTDARGRRDFVASRKVATQMVAAYRIVFGPAFPTRHSARRAVDMSITWAGPLRIADGTGRIVTITTTPRVGADNRQLHAVGATYGVLKLVVDRPHWSDNGH